MQKNYHGNTARRSQSRGEEIANSISHAIGLLAALVSAPLLIVSSVTRGDKAAVVGMSIFAATMVLMYLTSTLYHALPQKPLKVFFRVLDHCAIYLLIAGTYTPFTLGILSGTWGWIMLGLAWSLALVGILLKVTGGMAYPKLSVALYLAMGWLIVVAVKPLWLNMPSWGLLWLLAGGLAYSSGVVFYALGERMRFSHFIWHLFVIAGTAFHFIAVWKYAW